MAGEFGHEYFFGEEQSRETPEQNKDGIISGNYKIVEGKSRYEFYLYI